MQGLVRTRLVLFLLGVFVVLAGTVGVALFARGYRPGGSATPLQATGILVSQSYPDGAEIYLNSNLISATNSTLNLPPGDYTIEMRLDGFTPWKKAMVVQAGEVTRATAWLFPSVPSLRAITSTGASHPSVSPNGATVAYTLTSPASTRLYTLELSESPLGAINRESRLIATLPAITRTNPISQLVWSPDSRSLLVSATTSATLVNINSAQLTDVTDRQNIVVSGWRQELVDINTDRLPLLPKPLRDLLATSAAELVWSPREDKILYTATASAIIPDNLIRPLPGSSTQAQTRDLEAGMVYVYDLEEDRNFLIGPSLPTPPGDLSHAVGYYQPGGYAWFPTSNHLVRIEGTKVQIMEYDGQNTTIVYAGPLQETFAAAYPSTKHLLILTNLNPESSVLPNLYAVSLR